VLLLLSSAPALFCADARIRLPENALKGSLTADELIITGSVVNSGPADISGSLLLEILDPTDSLQALHREPFTARPGTNAVVVHLKRPPGPGAGEKDPLLWQRIRYQVQTNLAPQPVQEGIVALAAVIPDLFEIQVVHGPDAIEGHAYQVRVHAANPVTRRPVAGVRVKGELAFPVLGPAGIGQRAQPGNSGNAPKAAQTPQVAVRQTDTAGDALLVFHVPRLIDTTEGELRIEASAAGVVQVERVDVELGRSLRFIINTDKRLYQPGQALHVRTLLFDSNPRAVPGAPVQFSLLDPENQMVFRGEGTTNRFGIANVDWDLPDNLRLGVYRIEVEYQGEREYEGDSAFVPVRISRYELPTFTVSVKSDRNYYLPGQDADLEVAADYLFGKPVAGGPVRVARETERRWDYKKQNWVISEAETYTAELDSRGRAKVHLGLSALHDDFQDQTYRRYRDYAYAAFVTDATTGRTEQRRFQLRLTHNPIHVYVTGEQTVRGLLSFYVSTSYADGRPARCQVRVSEIVDDKSSPAPVEPAEEYLRSVRTSRYGVARVLDLPVREATKNARSRRLVFVARDAAGVESRHVEGWSAYEPDYQVRTDKTLYRDKEPILVSVRAQSSSSGQVLVDLAREGVLLRSHRVQLRNGRGFVVFPYELEFRGELGISAYSLEAHGVTWQGVRAVLYPEPTELQVTVRPGQTTYRPGDQAAASVRVSSPSGAGRESALGVVVLDKAVDERMRTDEEFGSPASSFWDWGWMREPISVGGISRAQLDKLNMSEPLPDGLDVVAEVILNSRHNPWLPEVEGGRYRLETRALFVKRMQAELQPVSQLLNNPEALGASFPLNTGQLSRLLASARLQLDSLRDPWGTPYRFRFGLQYRYRTVEVASAGPDKVFETPDDIKPASYRWEYFAPVGKVIDRAVKEAYARSGGYVRDWETLRKEVQRAGIDLAGVSDPWGRPYHFSFGVNAANFTITVESSGPPEGRSPPANRFAVWTSRIDYFAEARQKIDAALADHARKSGAFPQSEPELKAVLAGAALSLDELRDPWDHAYYATFKRSARYGDITVVEYDPSRTQEFITPATRVLDWITVWSYGPDGEPGTSDDFTVASYAQVVSTQTGRDLKPVPVSPLPLASGTGGIEGTVVDPSGAVIAGANVSAVSAGGATKYSAVAGPDGEYLLRGLPPGTYTVEVTAPGFARMAVRDVPVHSSSLTTLNVRLTIGGITQTVVVEAESLFPLMASAAAVSAASSAQSAAQLKVQEFTPRLRQFFPETLYWQPSLITDKGGGARLDFKLADNITTWKLAVVASSEKGEVGFTETEISSFQPFFIEHDPPRVLTVGDRIELPVVIRNYERQRQQVRVTMKAEPWFTSPGTEPRDLSIEAGDSARAVFPFTATASVKNGKQRVTAASRNTGDTVEKNVQVHPDGQEITRSAAQLVSSDRTLDISIPADALPGSLSAEVRIYPNLLAHVIDGIEGSLQRPYGCGEQTISSTYPSLLVAKHYRNEAGARPAVAGRAENHVRLGYQRLLRYRESSGGFTYWGRGEPDPALTAYALRFLVDASGFAEVDQSVVESARRWLLTHQQPDGSWQPRYGRPEPLTAYVARVLAASAPENDPKASAGIRPAVERALSYLAPAVERTQDAYIGATYALAAWLTGDRDRARQAASRLASMQHRTGDTLYWALETNTPFYGWGTAGRVETTALVLEALAAIQAGTAGETGSPPSLMDAGLRFLLKEKDRYGVWYSGQATVNVLEALTQLIASAPSGAASGSKAVVFVNGSRAAELDIPPPGQAAGPLAADVSAYVAPGMNRVEVSRTGISESASFSVTYTYYAPWKQGQEVREGIETDESRALRLAVDFDHTNTQAGAPVRCTVQAERIGHRGYGMLLAEIGLPPGADVDRASLERAVQESGWGVMQYDVLPDRVVLYLWPVAGGTTLDFTFRPRFGIQAKSAASILYDYYNSEAQVTLPPVHFEVQPPAESLRAR
jgi:hypothetical protein